MDDKLTQIGMLIEKKTRATDLPNLFEGSIEACQKPNSSPTHDIWHKMKVKIAEITKTLEKMGKSYANSPKLVNKSILGREVEADFLELLYEDELGTVEDCEGSNLNQQSNETNSNVSRLLPVIIAYQVFDESSERVLVQKASALTAGGINSIVFPSKLFCKVLKIDNDGVMLFKLHENEYGKIDSKFYEIFKNMKKATHVLSVRFKIKSDKHLVFKLDEDEHFKCRMKWRYKEMDKSRYDGFGQNNLIYRYVSFCCLEEARKVFDTMSKRDCLSMTTLISGLTKSVCVDEAREVFELVTEKCYVLWNAMIANTVVLLAARASQTENQDTIDTAIFGMYTDPKEARVVIQELYFLPFNSVDKCTASTYLDRKGHMHWFSKGAPELILNLAHNKLDIDRRVHSIIDKFADRGLWSLAVAYPEVPEGRKESDGGPWQFIGLLPLFNPPRIYSAETIRRALNLEVKVKMITWDQLAIGKETGRHLGIETNMYPSSTFLGLNKDESVVVLPVDELTEKAYGSTGVFPEHKYEIVKHFFGCVQSDRFHESFALFDRMRKEEEELDKYVAASMLSTCMGLGALEQGEWIHEYIKRSGIDVDSKLATTINDMYCKCGCLDKAFEAFNGLSVKEILSWNCIIGGLATHGKAEAAIELLKLIEIEKVEHDYITFVSILSARAHFGLVKEGQYYFKYITEYYGIEPEKEHFGCLVDLLGKAGNTPGECTWKRGSLNTLDWFVTVTGAAQTLANYPLNATRPVDNWEFLVLLYLCASLALLLLQFWLF